MNDIERKNLEIARLEWERRFLLNKWRGCYAIGSYGMVDPFNNKDFYQDEEAKSIEKTLRDTYIKLSGDVSSWYISEFKHFLSPYGYYIISTETDKNYNVIHIGEQRSVALLDFKTPSNGYFKISSFKHPAECLKQIDDNFLEVRKLIFNWEK